eukprot:4504743-Amphidinium_carterae.2
MHGAVTFSQQEDEKFLLYFCTSPDLQKALPHLPVRILKIFAWSRLSERAMCVGPLFKKSDAGFKMDPVCINRLESERFSRRGYGVQKLLFGEVFGVEMEQLALH